MITQSKKYIAVLLIGILIGSLFGYFVGVYSTVKIVAHIAVGFIEIDKQLIEDAILKYYHAMGVKYPSKIKNALNNSNEGE